MVFIWHRFFVLTCLHPFLISTASYDLGSKVTDMIPPKCNAISPKCNAKSIDEQMEPKQKVHISKPSPDNALVRIAGLFNLSVMCSVTKW